jgi:hypothetical protein
VDAGFIEDTGNSNKETAAPEIGKSLDLQSNKEPPVLLI